MELNQKDVKKAKAEAKSKKLFLIDGLGASVSAFFLGVVLVRLEAYFGIPPPALYLLAVFPIIFSVYDFFAFRQKPNKQAKFLMAIGIANLIYCCLSLGVLFYNSQLVTRLGWTYILVEILIVIFLATAEIKTAKRMMAKAH